MKSRTLMVLLIGVALLCVAQPAFADNVYATIRGVAADPQGAVVADAQVVATNTSTGVNYTTKSQGNGSYQFLQLPIGNYNVTASKQGFKSFKTVGITLVVNQIYDLPIRLEVGVVSETVEVKADAVQVETTSTQQKTLIDSQQIVDLPLIGRNFTQLQQLAPGVVSSADRFGTFATNGSQTQQNSFLINGTDSNDIPLNTPLQLPSPDAIQEFNQLSSTIDPEYGRNSGAIVNAVIKNGTNQWHGNVFDFYRDTFLNTRSFFTVGPNQPVFHQNLFGGTFGGPVKKDKTFFFFSYQGTRNRTSTSQTTNVLTAAQRAGDFSGDNSLMVANVKANGLGNIPVGLTINGDDGLPHTGTVAGVKWFGTGTSGAVFNCGAAITASLTKCPNPNFGKLLTPGQFNSISAALIAKFVPLPNTTTNAFGFNPINTAKPDQYIWRVDHNLTTSDSIWGVGFIQKNKTFETLPFTGANLDGFHQIDTRNIYQYTAAYNHTFSTTMLNELRFGWSYFNFDAVEPETPALPSSFGFTGITPQNAKGAGMPVITVNGLFTLGFSNNGPQPRKDQTYQATDNFSLIKGNHTMKFGFDGRRFTVDNPFFFQNDGSFSFNAANSTGLSSGNSAVDFLFGNPDSYGQSAGGVINARAYEYYGYAQDSWKVKNNLTINFGTGYDVETPFKNNQNGGLAFNCYIPGQQSKIFPSAPNSLNFPGDPGCNNAGATTKYNHLAPRFGFAWSPELGKLSGGSGKFSIRGGVGVYYNRTDEEGALQNLGAPPFGFSSGGALAPGFANPFIDIGGGTPVPNPFPFNSFPKPGDSPDFNSSVDPATGNPIPGLDLNTVSPFFTVPRAVNYNLNIQRELPARTILQVGYVGAMGRHLYRAYEANPITIAGQAACAASTACQARRTLQHLFFPTHSLTNGLDILSMGQQITDGTSNYSSLQVNVTKGMTHGLQLITSYTWSHSIDNGSGLENSGFGNRGIMTQFPYLNVGDSLQDARQRLVLGYVYAIPSLHSVVSMLPDKVFGGWKISGITAFQSGFAFNITDTGRRSLYCDSFAFYGCGDGPNQLNNLQYTNARNQSFTNALVGQKQNNYYFDPNQFVRAPIGTIGNVQRNSIHGPGLINTDLAFLKETKLTERTNLQIGIEGFNVFNHAQFNNPSGSISSPNFGRITSSGQGRLVQLRAKFSF